jgi:hypothetical protein
MTELPGGPSFDSALPGAEEAAWGSGKRRRVVFAAFLVTWVVLMAFVAQLLVTVNCGAGKAGWIITPATSLPV